MRNGQKHPKNYPHWNKVVELLEQRFPDITITQIGVTGEPRIDGVTNYYQNLALDKLKYLVESCDTWISVDSFFQHFCWDLGKPGVVIFAQSDPLIFGHPENINLLKSRAYLREKQFWMWEQAEFNLESFVDPLEVVKSVSPLIKI